MDKQVMFKGMPVMNESSSCANLPIHIDSLKQWLLRVVVNSLVDSNSKCVTFSDQDETDENLSRIDHVSSDSDDWKMTF